MSVQQSYADRGFSTEVIAYDGNTFHSNFTADFTIERNRTHRISGSANPAPETTLENTGFKVGDWISFICHNTISPFVTINQATGVQIFGPGFQTTKGTAGSIAGEERFTSLKLRCVAPDTWVIEQMEGSWTVT